MPTPPRTPPRRDAHRPVTRSRAYDTLPDVRDGLTRIERVILVTLSEIERERPGRMVPTAMLYGRVVERVDITPAELQNTLARLGARRH